MHIPNGRVTNVHDVVMVETFIMITEQVERDNSLQHPEGDVKGSLHNKQVHNKLRIFAAGHVCTVNK